MAFPTSPIDNQIHTETLTGKVFRYSSANNIWSPERRSDLLDLDDVSDAPPIAGQSLSYDASTSTFVPDDGSGSPYVGITRTNVDPTESDLRSVGSIWTNKYGTVEEKAWIATQTDGTRTYWQRIGEFDDPHSKLVIPVSPTEPSIPFYSKDHIPGTIWFDNSSGSIVKKCYINDAWVTLN